ncbi:MAG: hypothetical protein GKR89_14885 [Candidatus Latescibacteria bacterium]|nr:hypothetical protein [Candidatus Latescibacterota bacterium]
MSQTMHPQGAHAQPPAHPWPRRLLRWLIALTLPGFVLALLASGGLWLEYRSQYFTSRLGHFLLSSNPERLQHGAVWQGILASRQSRARLEGDSSIVIAPENLPAALRDFTYHTLWVGSDELILRIQPRQTRLNTEDPSKIDFHSLAPSLRTYRQGLKLLDRINLPRPRFRTQAHVEAQLALEDGTLYGYLHRELGRRNDPAAWLFVHMEKRDKTLWRGFLGPYISARLQEMTDGYRPLQEYAPEVAQACQAVLDTWADSLYTQHRTQLQEAWTQGAQLQLDLVRNMDRFAGEATVPGVHTTHFTAPSAAVEQLAGFPGVGL